MTEQTKCLDECRGCTCGKVPCDDPKWCAEFESLDCATDCPNAPKDEMPKCLPGCRPVLGPIPQEWDGVAEMQISHATGCPRDSEPKPPLHAHPTASKPAQERSAEPRILAVPIDGTVEQGTGSLPSAEPGEPLVRYGLEWTGPMNPVGVLMADGYWTPWHIAERTIADLRADLAEREAEIERATNAKCHCACHRLSGGDLGPIDHGMDCLTSAVCAYIKENASLRADLAEREAENDALRQRTGNAGCADGHIPIRWNTETDWEACPFCAALKRAEKAEARVQSLLLRHNANHGDGCSVTCEDCIEARALIAALAQGKP